MCQTGSSTSCGVAGVDQHEEEQQHRQQEPTTTSPTDDDGSSPEDSPSKPRFVIRPQLRRTVSGENEREDFMRACGFSSTLCTRCGIDYVQTGGILMQCARCKTTYYCSNECLQADRNRHSQYCGLAKVDAVEKFHNQKSHGETTTLVHNNKQLQQQQQQKQCWSPPVSPLRRSDDRRIGGSRKYSGRPDAPPTAPTTDGEATATAFSSVSRTAEQPNQDQQDDDCEEQKVVVDVDDEAEDDELEGNDACTTDDDDEEEDEESVDDENSDDDELEYVTTDDEEEYIEIILEDEEDEIVVDDTAADIDVVKNDVQQEEEKSVASSFPSPASNAASAARNFEASNDEQRAQQGRTMPASATATAAVVVPPPLTRRPGRKKNNQKQQQQPQPQRQSVMRGKFTVVHEVEPAEEKKKKEPSEGRRGKDPLRRTISGELEREEHLAQQGFSSTCCMKCNKDFVDADGFLMQCSRCKLAYYCSYACMNADYDHHSQYCGVPGFKCGSGSSGGNGNRASSIDGKSSSSPSKSSSPTLRKKSPVKAKKKPAAYDSDSSSDDDSSTSSSDDERSCSSSEDHSSDVDAGIVCTDVVAAGQTALDGDDKEVTKEAPSARRIQGSLRPSVIRGKSCDDNLKAMGDVQRLCGGKKQAAGSSAGHDCAEETIKEALGAPRIQGSLRPSIVRGISCDDDLKEMCDLLHAKGEVIKEAPSAPRMQESLRPSVVRGTSCDDDLKVMGDLCQANGEVIKKAPSVPRMRGSLRPPAVRGTSCDDDLIEMAGLQQRRQEDEHSCSENNAEGFEHADDEKYCLQSIDQLRDSVEGEGLDEPSWTVGKLAIPDFSGQYDSSLRSVGRLKNMLVEAPRACTKIRPGKIGEDRMHLHSGASASPTRLSPDKLRSDRMQLQFAPPSSPTRRSPGKLSRDRLQLLESPCKARPGTLAALSSSTACQRSPAKLGSHRVHGVCSLPCSPVKKPNNESLAESSGTAQRQLTSPGKLNLSRVKLFDTGEPLRGVPLSPVKKPKDHKAKTIDTNEVVH